MRNGGRVHVTVRVPRGIVKIADILVELGFFKDRSDFINYAMRETIKEFLPKIRIKITPELIERYFKLVEEVSPRLSEEEVVQLVKEIRDEKESGS
ncbi:MAG: hypothetical protein B6U94_05980 [Thermofilum sp. ex4484_79]|nr:MAG: hypothetical protein B6U94_05980 [Thermofilum sp. ex4484_79]